MYFVHRPISICNFINRFIKILWNCRIFWVVYFLCEVKFEIVRILVMLDLCFPMRASLSIIHFFLKLSSKALCQV